MVLLNNYVFRNIDKVSYAVHYNTLPTIEEANEALKAAPCFQEALEKVAHITRRYKCESYIGLRLIHKHFPIEEGQIMVEDIQDIDGEPALVTQTQDWEQGLNKNALPSSWIFSEEGAIHTYETSVDPAVQSGIDLIEKNPKMMIEIKKELQAYKLDKLLAVALLKRSSLETRENQFYLEKEYCDQSRTVLQVCDRETPEAINAISTAWSFKRSKRNKMHVSIHTGCSN